MARILHISKYHPPFAGGIESFVADLMPAQIKQGHTVAAIVHDHQPSIKKIAKKVSAEAGSAGELIYRVPSFGRLLYAPISPHFPFWLKKVIQEFKPDCLHIHVPNTSAFWLLSLKCARDCQWVVHWHSDVISTIDSRLSLAYHLYRPFEQALLKRANKIIATSPPYLQSSAALSAWHDKSQVIALGIDSQRLPEPTESALQWAQQRWQKDSIKILTIGRLTYYKGHEVLIRALAACQNKNIEVCIVGKGEQQESLQQLIHSLGLQKQVHLLGFCEAEQLTALLAYCDCFCLPSLERTEAFGVVLMEAMRYAKPVIASNIEGSGVTWVVTDKITGTLVPPLDADALATALDTLAQQPERYHDYGQAGYQRFQTTFDIDKVAKAIQPIYENQ